MLNVEKKDADFITPNFKTKVSRKARFKIKWKTIQWLMDYKKGISIDRNIILIKGAFILWFYKKNMK